MFNIVAFTSADQDLYKNSRLESWREEPYAFTTSYEDALTWTDQKWQQKLAEALNPEISLTFLAKNEGGVVGHIHAEFNSQAKRRHVLELKTLYVSPAYRRNGIAQALLQAVLDQLPGYPFIRKIGLSVAATQEQAIRFYHKNGFVEAGRLVEELQYNDAYFDQLLLDKFLTPHA
jgi:ribosomal protein S18 acetylase RimI-like enzyme